MSSTNFYHKVSQLDAKELIEFVDHNQTELTLKINNQYVKTNVLHIKNEKYFSVFKFHNFDFSNEPILCSFRSRDEIFFFNSYLNSSKVEYLIDLPAQIFQLQRRNDFRIAMPIGTSHYCKINYVRGIIKNIDVEIRDLSLGGCQISIPAHELEIKSGDEFDVTLKLDRFDFNRLNLVARHVKTIKEQDNLLVGASFVNLDGEDLAEMRSLLMFLDRKSRGKSD